MSGSVSGYYMPGNYMPGGNMSGVYMPEPDTCLDSLPDLPFIRLGIK